MHSSEALRYHYDRIQQEGVRLAGGLQDVEQRAATYHHLFEHSGSNHAFPLIAAHGALWSTGYFRFGMRLGRRLVWQYAHSAQARREKLAALERFADAFREVNRRVCVDTYTSYHFTARFGGHPQADGFVRSRQLAALNRVHAARRGGKELSEAERREVFVAHFFDEQERVVSPSLAAAEAEFDWPLLKFIALRPRIRFAYFGRREALRFRRFDDQQQRIEQGLRAFEIASAAGWTYVAATLRHYGVLPDEFFAGTARHFANLRSAVLNASA
jgi:hypothetical protein